MTALAGRASVARLVFVAALLVAVSSTPAVALSWREARVPLPSGATETYLFSVSCVSERFCVAVGYADPSIRYQAAAVTWNGTAWSAMAPVHPSGARYSELEAVSCISERWCMAVGSYVERSGVRKTLAEVWNGSSWSVSTTPNPTGTAPRLHGLDCTSEAFCMAVGSFAEARGRRLTLGQSWNGLAWSSQRTIDLPEALEHELQAVSCPTSSYCIAAGSFEVERVALTMAQSWNGRAWEIEEPLDPEEGFQTLLRDVSCVSTSYCVTAGAYFERGAFSLAESWDGREWEFFLTPDPAEAESIQFEGVSCASRTFCVAVGFAVEGVVGQNLVEMWNGLAWTIQPVTEPTTTSGLFSVSCPSAGFCMAVGYGTREWSLPALPQSQKYA